MGSCDVTTEIDQAAAANTRKELSNKRGGERNREREIQGQRRSIGGGRIKAGEKR